MREIRCDKFVELVKATERIEPTLFTSLESKHKQNHSAILYDILDKGILKRDEAGELWAKAIGFTYVNPLNIQISGDEKIAIPQEMAKRIKAIHLYEFDGYITMAMEDPANRQMVDSLERFLQKRVSPVFSLPEDIQHAIELHYQSDTSFDAALRELEAFTEGQSKAKEDREALMELMESNALIEMTNRVFVAAFKQKASDIHIEAHKGYGTVRFRVDGHLRDIVSLPERLHKALIVRIKFISQLDIADTRLPQDGRFTLEIGAYSQNFRLSTLPGLHGEKAVIRLLGQAGQKGLPNFDELLFSRSNLRRFRAAVAKPNGIFIVTGPTGSGKTTTLYSALDYLNDRDRNIMTIEDPVEYQLPGVNHFEVKHKIELDFKRVLRAALRQDPDVILVGEVRDKETAKIAVEAALTGHMVLTTLHTNNAIQAIIRLIEIGVDPYMLAPALNGVMSQRLVGKICSHCKESYEPARELLVNYFKEDSLPESPLFYRGRGCPACHKTGFAGRVAIHEIVEISEEIRNLISRRAELNEIQKAANVVGYVSLREDAIKKAMLGLTTLDEVERITVPEYHTY